MGKVHCYDGGDNQECEDKDDHEIVLLWVGYEAGVYLRRSDDCLISEL
jgi:hypothetical protein